jgi:hypothetical protein
VHVSVYILETKCKGRAAHILVVQFVIQPPVERKKIARDWRRSSSRKDESKAECEGRKEGGVCAWRVDLRVNGREIESESMASAQRWWTCGESADGELAVSWWALINRIDLRVVGRVHDDPQVVRPPSSLTPTGVGTPPPCPAGGAGWFSLLPARRGGAGAGQGSGDF